MPKPAKISVTILSSTTKLIERHDINPPTGHQPGVVGARNVCQDVCRGTGARFFAIPSFVTKGGTEKWLVFEMQPKRNISIERNAVLLRDWPTRDSAEMWMQHNGS